MSLRLNAIIIKDNGVSAREFPSTRVPSQLAPLYRVPVVSFSIETTVLFPLTPLPFRYHEMLLVTQMHTYLHAATLNFRNV